MKNVTLLFIAILYCNISFSKENTSKKNIVTPFSYQDYVYYYGVNDTSIAIINVFFDNQNRLGIGQISFLPLTTAISLVNPPIGLVLMLITTPMVAHGLVSYGKFSDDNLVSALENYQFNNFISENLRKRLDKYLDVKKIEEKEINQADQIAVLKSIYNTNK